MSEDYRSTPSTVRTAERAYERMFLEMLLRHELPDDCTVRIYVTPKAQGQTGKAEFALKGDQIDVESDIGLLNLARDVYPSPPNW